MEYRFTLTEEFLDKYKNVRPPFGFNGLGELVYIRTYSRLKEDGVNEEWWETVRRVVEGTYTIQKNHILKYHLGWDDDKAQQSAQEMYDRMFQMKFLPPGRGLWAMGTDLTIKRNLFAALNNCAFVSTDEIDQDATKPFEFLMDMSMLGVGVGFDVKGAGLIGVFQPDWNEAINFEIPDTREGWVQSVGMLLDAYFHKGRVGVNFDYSKIRKAGEPIKGFGGVSSGPGPLIKLHKQINDIFSGRESGSPLSTTDIVDVMNMIGCCVVAGNVRRSAEIVFGDPSDEEYLKLKDYTWNQETGEMEGSNVRRAEFGWSSNNSVFAGLGMDYTKVAAQTAVNGEPGYIWLDNIQKFGRLVDGEDNKDRRAAGTNPCAEQSLESYEMCCLVETFPTRAESKEDFLRTLKFAYLYAKTVTLGNTHCAETNRVLLRNRRIGTSMSGIAQFVESHGLDEFKTWCDEGYHTIQDWDTIYSEWLCVPRSVKTTSIKPSGTVSLLPGVTPGIHYPESNHYIRRIRIAEDSPLIKKCIDAGYDVEPSVSEANTMVVSVPVHIPNVRTLNEVSIWEQVSLAAFLQKYWADNQVSVTVTFKKDEASQINPILNYYQYQLKSVSFLPKLEKGAVFPQMPYEEITREKYLELEGKLKNLDFRNMKGEDAESERFCDGDSCVIK
ncbi:glycyl radical enzyme family protein [Sediminitomix flava]|uniref:ribonucleoside-triphosphate reductase (thioredoxin) n=1 Tax=Sediminitomix flava TaxID=379075 RepID=A0A316A5L7_SEDFL|nr:fused protease/ribonucleoside-triphosphate reductase [Sediminitomix flava]PWJ45067.1 adenosylcobalamin-dependent ribonucleoside-triphosphate reductase [Sediminitomix flava]